jgi:hypothetical protein
MNRLPIRWLLAAGTAVTLAACGGGGDTGSTPPSTTPSTTAPASATSTGALIATGTITGFGSVIVDGVKYDDSAATVKVEDDASSPRSVALSELKLGMQVEVKADDSGKAGTVTISSEVYGRITGLRADGFVVAGQTVKVSTDTATPTVFEGVSGLSGLALNDFVEVHGKRDADGAIVASRIERKDPGSVAAVRIAGSVAGLDTAAKSFTLGGLTVKYDDTTRVLPGVASLVDGVRVAVWSSAAPTGNTLTAKTIVVKKFNAAANDKARVGGLVRELAFATRRFKVDGVEVDATSATFTKGTVSDLANGRAVRVAGTFTDNLLKATDVRFVKDQGDAEVQLTGVVTDFAGKQFKVRGVPVDVSDPAVVYENGSFDNLASGVLVKIEGVVAGSVVTPKKVVFVTADDDRSRWLLGEVSAFQSTTGTFKLMGVDAKLAETATFRNADGSAATKADFGNGDRVQVRGAFVSGVFVATEVVFRPGVQLVIDSVEGSAYEVNLTAGVFKLNGTVVKLGPTTVFEGSRENLRNGVKVEVDGTIVAGEFVATKIEIKTPSGEVEARLKGAVSAYVSLASFKVAGQAVDASTATVEPAGATIADGRVVEVMGSLESGVVKATRVKVK